MSCQRHVNMLQQTKRFLLDYTKCPSNLFKHIFKSASHGQRNWRKDTKNGQTRVSMGMVTIEFKHACENKVMHPHFYLFHDVNF